jgi:hypothetical protein
MIWVTRAEYIADHKLRVPFNDGLEGCIDLHETIFQDHRKLFRELRDREMFSRFMVAMDTVVWENGLDLAPEFLHDLLLSSSGSHRVPVKDG